MIAPSASRSKSFADRPAAFSNRFRFSVRVLAAATWVGFLVATPSEGQDHFELREIATDGRTVAAGLADLDGDGRTDLLQVVFTGIPPKQNRHIRIFKDVANNERPIQVDLPPGAAGYDIGNVDGKPGDEIVLLRQRDLVLLSLQEGSVRQQTIGLPWGSIATRDEERGLTRLRLIERTSSETWLIAQGFGQLAVLRPDGTVLADLGIGGVSTNYIFESPGLGFAESPIELNYVPARISVARVDQDERTDIVAAWRHGIRVFLQRGNGTFADPPHRDIPLSLVTEGDYIRGSGGAATHATDINGDGLADLLISYVTGGITDAGTVATLHLNREGLWDLKTPDQKLTLSDRGSLTLIDLDGDQRPELVQMTTPFSTMEIIEALATRSLDGNIAIFRAAADRPFQTEPWSASKLSLPISFETFAPTGFLPTWQADLNSDGHRDLVTSGSGDRLEVYLGGPEYRYEKRAAKQTVGNSGKLLSGDIDGDQRTDLVIFDPHRSGEPIKLLRNRGTLPGSPSVLEAPKATR